MSDEEFEKLVEGMGLNADDVENQMTNERISDLLEKNVGEFLDMIIKSAARRRIVMLGNGFTSEDVSTMLSMYLDFGFRLASPDTSAELWVESYEVETEEEGEDGED